MVRLTDRPDMTLDVYRGRKTTIQYNKVFDRRFLSLLLKRSRSERSEVQRLGIGWLVVLGLTTLEAVFQSISGRLPKERERKDSRE